MANERSVGQVLLKLLDRVPDSNTLEILLAPENLLKLLQIYGQDKKAIRQALKGDKLPGEFLLELLDKEPDTGILLAQLGNPVIPQKPIEPIEPPSKPSPLTQPPVLSTPVKAASTTSKPTTIKTKRLRNLFGKYYKIVALTVFTLSSVMPALIIAGFMTPLQLTPETASVLAFIGGAVAGAISNPDARFSWIGLVVGIVYSLSALWATIIYTQYRTTILRIELAIPLVLAGIPAAIMYYVLWRVGKLIAPKKPS